MKRKSQNVFWPIKWLSGELGWQHLGCSGGERKGGLYVAGEFTRTRAQILPLDLFPFT